MKVVPLTNLTFKQKFKVIINVLFFFYLYMIIIYLFGCVFKWLIN